MLCRQRLLTGDARNMVAIDTGSIDLIVTSPPYPMIAMWDGVFDALNPRIGAALQTGDAASAYQGMHAVLRDVWAECLRVLSPGGFLCVNIGDATRTIAGRFRLFTNHARVRVECETLGFDSLPAIVWRKPTNAPNKFMGSGMLPAGAYITLEHEYILVFRKPGKRVFGHEDVLRRRQSACFWEERNTWFSDLWDLLGITQTKTEGMGRDRSAAFPFEIPFRLIHMFSLQGDWILDPFGGTGTTSLAAMAGARNSVSLDIEAGMRSVCARRLSEGSKQAQERSRRRLADHLDYVTKHEGKRKFLYRNNTYDVPVVTAQETALTIPVVDSVDFLLPEGGEQTALAAYTYEHAGFRL